jgi:WD40 repeat protein
VFVFDARTGRPHRHHNLVGHDDTVTCMIACPQLGVVISGSCDGRARVWKLKTGKCVHALKMGYGEEDEGPMVNYMAVYECT